ncbi:MAG: sensor histidine kinase [Verrucomicrobia bacterium]|nr:sensor histidine kinase [Verrucomicrobiota bacterium]
MWRLPDDIGSGGIFYELSGIGKRLYVFKTQQLVDARVVSNLLDRMNSTVVSRLVEYFRDRQSQIIGTWIKATQNDPKIKSSRTISEPELADHLPRLMSDLAGYLQSAGSESCAEKIRQEARKHGNQRWRQGYQLAELLREIAIIRRLIVVDGLFSFFRLRPEYSDEHHDATDLIDRFFENVTAGSVDQYVENFAVRLNEAARSSAEANDRLREIDASRLSSIRGLAHDLGNFVNALSWAVENFASTTNEPGRVGPLDVLRRNLEDVGSLVRQLTDYSVLLAGEFRLEIEEISLSLLCQEIRDSYGPIAEASGLTLRVTNQPSLQSIRSDRHKLNQIVSNLISNSIKYRKRDEPGGLVELAFQPLNDEHWRLSVSDSGVGIPAEELETIFEESYRGAAIGDVPGMGLGLAITQRLVLLLGGTITVSSEVGRGSQFILTFPRTPPTKTVSDAHA